MLPRRMKTLLLEDLWDRAKANCRARNLPMNHGAFQGAPPICGYYAVTWMQILKIPYVQGTVVLDMDSAGEWFAQYEEPHAPQNCSNC